MEITFETLRPLYRTGMAVLLSGEGRNKKYDYRHGISTKLGNLEESEWRHLAISLIKSVGEVTLFENLLEWETENSVLKKSRQEVELYALELHISRIFDNPLWMDYVAFNQRFRVSVLASKTLIQVTCNHCGKIGEITTEMLRHSSDSPKTIQCPSCGVFTTFQPLANKEVPNE